MKKIILHFLSILIMLAGYQTGLQAQYVPHDHAPLPEGVIPVNGPGNYGKPGATYMLTRDISSSRSALFLGKDVTLDLNGYTVTFADTGYQHVQNYGFEDGVTGWDLSKAPGARLENTADVHVFIGDKLLRLRAGDEIASSYVYLPVSGRSYDALCGVTGNYYNDMGGDLSKDMRISVFVDDEQGREVRCITRYGDSTRMSCPVLNRSAHLGGGFVFAHLNHLPAGKYRIRVRAETDCLVDEIDIRPAMDVGIGIVGRTDPMGHYDHLYNRNHAAFFDYTADVATGRPLAGIPVVQGSGTVTIKNGIIRNGTVGFLSWGIQSTADSVKVILDNVKIISSGINTIAVDVPQATVTHCSFDIHNPFIINRHGSEFYAVDLRGPQPSEVSFSEFFGGQGCLSFKGEQSSIHHNFFMNRQTVTNHYSIMAMGDGSKIFDNVFKPEIGSGIEIFRHKNIDIFNNEFHITAAPPSCEYNDMYSTNAIRIADYGARPGSPDGSYGNRVYNNRFFITGRYFDKYPTYTPLASALFYSASAGDNEIFGNDITVDQKNPHTTAEAYAFYIGNARGGKIYNNLIRSNVTPIWVASEYGKDENTEITGNILEKIPNATEDFPPVRMGSLEQPDYLADGVEFRSNILNGLSFLVDATAQHHRYTVYWTLTISVRDKKGNTLSGKTIEVVNKNGNMVSSLITNDQGEAVTELPEYAVDGNSRIDQAPYLIIIGKKKIKSELTQNTDLRIIL